MRKIAVTFMTLVLAGLLAFPACRKVEVPLKKAGPKTLVVDPADKKKEPESEFAGLRKKIGDYGELLKKCDEYWFSDVKGERIKNWDLPVDVQKMEDLCDPLLPLFEAIVEEGAYRCPELDEYLQLAARTADQYLMLAFRCKKVGVREKRPYIKRINALRDGLRRDVEGVGERTLAILKMHDDDFKRNARASSGALPRMTHEVLSGLSQVVSTFVVEPIEAERPTWRYSLRLADRIAGRAVENLRKKAPTDHLALAGPADALSREFKVVVNFFTGAWYNEEDGMDRKVLRKFKKADKVYRKNAARALKL